MRARYLGPCIVIARNRGGVYIIAELDGSIFDRPVAAFRVIPYFACSKLDLPPLAELLDISQKRLTKMTDAEIVDPEAEDDTDDVDPAEQPNDD